MRKVLNIWLRRWAEASLRNELHQTQEKLIRQQEVRLNLLAKSEEQSAASANRETILKQKHVAAVAYDSALIKALKARIPEDLFMAVVAHVKSKLEKE